MEVPQKSNNRLCFNNPIAGYMYLQRNQYVKGVLALPSLQGYPQ
jgi:hypothetical protein